MDEATMKKNAEFLIKTLPTVEIPGSAKVKCRYKKMVEFAKSFGYTDEKYIGSEEKGIFACPGFANAISVKAFYTLIPGVKIEQDGQMRDLLLNPNKLLHASQAYNWENCVPIKNGDSLIAKAAYEKAWVNESMVLFTQMALTVKNQNDELVFSVKTLGAIRPGGY